MHQQHAIDEIKQQIFTASLNPAQNLTGEQLVKSGWQWIAQGRCPCHNRGDVLPDNIRRDTAPRDLYFWQFGHALVVPALITSPIPHFSP